MKDVYGMMQEGKPYKSFIKTMLGKLYLTAWDSWKEAEIGVILEGDPRKKDDGCIIDVWNEKEEMFLRKRNKKHFETGVIIEYQRTEESKSEEEKINSMSDDEMIELLGKQFFSLQSAVNKFTSIAPVFRMLHLAKELDKSEKIVKFIEGKLSELQLAETESKIQG